MRIESKTVWALLLALGVACGACADEQATAAPEPNPRLPDTFCIVFTYGYGQEGLKHWPGDKDGLSKAFAKVREAHFNVILEDYDPLKLDMMGRHNLRFMVSLVQPEYNVWSKPEMATRLAASLKDDDRVWGYLLYGCGGGHIMRGRDRDTRTIHQADPKHPTIVGIKPDGASGVSLLTEPDIVAFEDFQWKENSHEKAFEVLSQFAAQSKAKGAYLYRWIRVPADDMAEDNYEKSRYVVNTSLAFGLKGIVWFLGHSIIDSKTWAFHGDGGDCVPKLNQETMAVNAALFSLKHIDVWSTVSTVHPRGAMKEEPGIPHPLNPIPADHWCQVVDGEVVMGLFEKHGKQDYLFLASHYVYQMQTLKLKAPPETQLERYDAPAGAWVKLQQKDGVFLLPLTPAEGVLVRRVTEQAE